mgnify:CR=1 FL=1
MRFHRYLIKITRPNSGETNYEVLGTLVGFSGLIAFILHAVFTTNMREATITTTIAIGSTYLIYWFSTQVKEVIYFLQLYLLALVVVLAVVSINLNGTCNSITEEYWFLRCQDNLNAALIWLGYFLINGVCCFYYLRRVWRKNA